jgi:hypothetical protein
VRWQALRFPKRAYGQVSGAKAVTATVATAVNTAADKQLALPPSAEPAATRVIATAWGPDGAEPVTLPWHYVGDARLSTELLAWWEYHLRAWQYHVAEILPGSNAEHPMIAARRSIAALLDDVDHDRLPIGGAPAGAGSL